MSKYLNERLRQYLAAEKAILVSGQGYRIGNRTLTRADLSVIRSEINALKAAGATEEDMPVSDNGARRTRRILFRD